MAQYALQYNIMFIFPDGENSFYLDQAGAGKKYCQYVGEELPAYVRKLFGLSDRREDTWIGGYSMGGYGALHTALAYPETFSKALALSSALIQHSVEKMTPGFVDVVADYDYYAATFGDPQKLADSPNNPEYLIKQLQAAGKALPDIYLAIGTEDFLYEENQLFRRFLTERKVPFTYEEGPGAHDFVFWDAYCRRALEWALKEE